MKKVMNFMFWECAGVQLKYNANDNFVQTADVTSDQGFPAGTPSLLSDTVLVKTKLYWSDSSVSLCHCVLPMAGHGTYTYYTWLA